MLIEFGGASAQVRILLNRLTLITTFLAGILSVTSGHAATPAAIGTLSPEAAITGKWEGESHVFQGVEFEIKGHKIKIGHCSPVPFSVMAVGRWGQFPTITIEIPQAPDGRKCGTGALGKVFKFTLHPDSPSHELTAADLEFYGSRSDLRLNKLAGASMFIRQNHPE